MKTTMKTTMKFFAALAIMMGFTMGAMAQDVQSDNASITGKAQVISAISVTKGLDLQFGLVTKGEIKTISTNNDVLRGTTGNSGGEQAGTFTVSKGVNTSVTLSFGFPAGSVAGTYALTDGASPVANELPLTFPTYSATKAAKLSGVVADYPFIPTADLTIIKTGALAGYYAAESFTVSIGGTVTPASDQAQGEYTGTIKLTATYN